MCKYLFLAVAIALTVLLLIYFSDYQVFLIFVWPSLLLFGFAFGFDHKQRLKHRNQDNGQVWYEDEVMISTVSEKMFGRGLIIADLIFVAWLIIKH